MRLIDKAGSISRRWIWIAAILAINATFAFLAWSPPQQRPAVDYGLDPFIGPQEVAAWLAPMECPYTFRGRVRSHRIWVALTACSAVALSIWSLRTPSSHSKPSCRSVNPLSIAGFQSRRVARIACAALSGAIIIMTCINWWRVPDFRRYHDSQMHVTLAHYDLLAAADHASAGDRLLVDVVPAYGILWPVVMGAYQKWFGLVSLGTIIAVLNTTNAAVMLLFVWGCYRWARGRLWCWIPPLILVLPYYVAVEQFLVPANHCLVRSGHLVIAPVVWLFALRYGPLGGPFLIGFCSVLALATNFEAGIAVVIGSLVAAFFQWFLPWVRCLPTLAIKSIAAYLVGAVVSIAAIESFAFATLGQIVPPLGIIMPAAYASASSGPLLTYPPQPWVVPLIVVMLIHAAATLLYISALPVRGVRHAARAAISSALLVWMAYPVNRPHTEYLYSSYLLYGFLLIDLVRALAATWRSQGAKRYPLPAALTFTLATLFVGIWWQMRSDVGRRGGDRSEAPLVSHQSEIAELSGVYLAESFADQEITRASFIARKVAERKGRVVFISSDAYLIGRLANTVPAQPYSEPGMCITKSMYKQYLQDVTERAKGELYFDSRAKTGATWYAFVNDMARRDLSRRFALIAHEDGWEIWRQLGDRSSRAVEGQPAAQVER